MTGGPDPPAARWLRRWRRADVCWRCRRCGQARGLVGAGRHCLSGHRPQWHRTCGSSCDMSGDVSLNGDLGNSWQLLNFHNSRRRNQWRYAILAGRRFTSDPNTDLHRPIRATPARSKSTDNVVRRGPRCLGVVGNGTAPYGWIPICLTTTNSVLDIGEQWKQSVSTLTMAARASRAAYSARAVCLWPGSFFDGSNVYVGSE